MTLAAIAFGHWMLLIGVIFVGMHMDVHGCTWMYIVHHCVARIKHAVYYINSILLLFFLFAIEVSLFIHSAPLLIVFYNML